VSSRFAIDDGAVSGLIKTCLGFNMFTTGAVISLVAFGGSATIGTDLMLPRSS
jgi:hypothetical protein